MPRRMRALMASRRPLVFARRKSRVKGHGDTAPAPTVGGTPQRRAGPRRALAWEGKGAGRGFIFMFGASRRRGRDHLPGGVPVTSRASGPGPVPEPAAPAAPAAAGLPLPRSAAC